ncbi:hypothetical protein JAAARDRAFT_159307 [Jaapia argillacea MUCL 33604]|uniref:Very-long-chain (3R)-3-hydroxyacyl-CoA dehydratase n=1 Tax=Jaapia argillacea MUCL 33604 TaxID=933084 RepID=A0A067PLS3_9AGAM|nr:hypothetical protein JAAARDRAFT_159307 [Jaapia argillacea MUCL 33604]
MSEVRKPKGASSARTREAKGSPLVKYYLIAYNVLSTLGWSYVLVQTILHLSNPTSSPSPSSPQTATSLLARYISSLPFSSSLPIQKISSIQTIIESKLPGALLPLWARSKMTYGAVGVQTALVQSFAVLEVVHVLFGWVRSPIGTTAMQVASRVFLVWGIVERFANTRTNPIYTSMILSWSLTEVIRYTFYAYNLISDLSKSSIPYWLTYLRYTTFYLLYPTGASSEAFLIYSTLPGSSPVATTTWEKWFGEKWGVEDYVRGVLFLIWWPGLYVMYTYMIKQRRKVLGGGQRLGMKPKTQ